MEVNAKITKGVAVKLTILQPNSVKFVLQFINETEVIDASATKPKTKKSFTL